jgi:hypothetical protein
MDAEAEKACADTAAVTNGRGERLAIVAIELAVANDFVLKLHRHHKPEVGHRFSLGAWSIDRRDLCGVAIVGRPKARMIDQRRVLEVTRVATDGTKNACSILYGAAVRAAKAIGYDEIITYTLASEPGTSLRAAGWQQVATVKGEYWSRQSRPRTTPNLGDKLKWRRLLRTDVERVLLAREPDPSDEWLNYILRPSDAPEVPTLSPVRGCKSASPMCGPH